MHDNVITKDEKALIDKTTKEIADRNKAVWDGLTSGLDLSSGGAGSSNQLTGSIKNITEETADVIAGQMNAMRMNQGVGINVMREQLFALVKIEANTRYNKLIYDKLSAKDGVINDLSGTGIKL